MALAAHALVLSVSADDATYSEVDGINDLSFGSSRTMLESTDFKDTSGAKTRFAGLMDGDISISGDYESADTGQALLRSSWASGAGIYVKMAWNGTAGHKVLCIIESYNIKGGVDAKVTFDVSLKFNGAPSTF